MMMASATLIKEVISFGPFSLIESERLLTRDGLPVALSARALDILIALSSRPNEVIDKSDLLAQVWPDVTVKRAACGFTSPACERRWAMERMAQDTS
jgi:DNA-binding winged helix-turn-helix (wHTH) protein